MADDTVKRLLIKLGIDRSEFDTAIKEIKRQLDGLYQAEKAKSAQRKTSAHDDVLNAQQQATAAKQLADATQLQLGKLQEATKIRGKALDQMKEELAGERVKLDAKSQVLRVMAQQGQLQGTALRNLQQEVALERTNLSIKQAQLRAAITAASADRRQGFAGGLLEGFSSRLAGTIGFSVLSAEGLGRIFEMAYVKVKELGRAIVEATGPAKNLREEFEHLVDVRGGDPSKIITNLRMATRGLVADEKLYQVGNAFMRSGVKLTSEQMAEMVKNVTNLARATGHDVTPALDALTRTFQTGRGYTLAYALGLTNIRELMVRGIPAGASDAVRANLQIAQTFRVLQEEAAKVIVPVTTLPELMKQMHVQSENFIEDIAKGVLSGGKFNASVADMSKHLIEMEPKLEHIAEVVGKGLGDALSFVVNHFDELKEVVKDFLGLALEIKIGSMVTSFLSWAGAIKGVAGAFGLLTAAQGAGALVAGEGAAAGAAAAEGGSLLALAAPIAGVVTAVISILGLGYLLYKNDGERIKADQYKAALSNFQTYGNPAGPKLATQRTFGSKEEANALTQKQGSSIAGMERTMQWVQSPDGAGSSSGPVGVPIDLELQRQLSQERLKLTEEEAKSRFAIIKEELDNEESALKAKYEIGLVDLNDYLDQEKALHGKELQARLQEIETDRKQKVASINQNASVTTTDATGKQVNQLENPQVTSAKIAAVNEAARSQSIQAEAQYQKQMSELLFKRLNDELAAQKSYQAAVIKLQKTSLDEQQKLLESHFKDGDISAETFIDKKRALINQEKDIVLSELDQELASSKKTEEEKAKIRIQKIEEQVAAQKKLTDLEESEDELRLQSVENRYKKQAEFVSTQEKLAQFQMQTGQPGAVGSNIQALQAAYDLNEQQLKVLTKMLETVHEGSKEWYQIVKDIGDVNTQLTETNKKLAAAKDIAAPLANIFEQMANIFAGTKTAKFLADLSKGMKDMSAWSKMVSEQGGGKSMIHGLGSSVVSLFRKTPTQAPITTSTPEQKMESAGESAKKFGDAVGGEIKTIKDWGTAASNSVQDLTVKWSQSVDSLNGKLSTEAEKLGGKLTSSVEPFTQVMNRATDAVTNFIHAISGQAAGTPGKSAGVYGPNQGPEVTTSDNTTGTLPTQGDKIDIQPVTSHLADQFKQLAGTVDKSKGKLHDWSSKMEGVLGKVGGIAQGVGGFVQSLQGVQSTKQGMLAGGMSGLQAGMQFGPYGAVIGAAAGVAIGAIVGHKEAQAKTQVEALKTKLDEIKTAISNDTVTMGQGINQLQQLRATTVSEMGSAGRKGAKAGLPQQLQAVNDELNQLMQQQQQILQKLATQLAVLMEPTQYQQILNNLSQIIQQYQQFASAAAGNNAAMGEANQWLIASLQQYVITMGNNVRSANEQAISDAEKLLDLQTQLNQENLQEYDILTSGVMGRQRSEAQTKGAQIEAIEQQKQQTESEYQLQQYKVTSEQKMFDLASSRLGLEQQMVQLQETDFNQWAQQVQAMQQTLAKLQGALGAGGTLPAGLLNATGGINMQSLEQLLGLPITATGPNGVGQPYIQNEPAVYQEFVDIIDQKTSFKNFGDLLQAAAATPFGSAQRQALTSDLTANNYEIAHALEAAGAIAKPVHGKSQDPNWLNFFSWIMNSAQAVTPGVAQPSVPTPGFAIGGMVPQDMTATVHAGEYVIPSDVFKDFINTIGNFTSIIRNGGPIINPRPYPIHQPGGGDVDVHKAIFDIASARVGMESDLLQMQRQQALLDMQRMSQMSDLVAQMYNVKGSGVYSLEGAFAKIYENRGRYGSGSFRRNSL